MEFLKKLIGKTVLITGATGLIGSNLVFKIASDKRVNVLAVGRSLEKLKRVFSNLGGSSNLRLIEHDINYAIPDAVGVLDYVFHAASPISGQIIRAEPMSVISANLSGVTNCLEYLRRQRESLGRVGTLVVFSSATVYGGAGVCDRWCSESDTSCGEVLDSATAPYSESKRMVEVIARAYANQFGLEVKIGRIGYVFGACPIAPKTAFYEFCEKARSGEDLVFNGSGFARRDNIYVDDVVSGLLCVCANGASGEAYNISSGGDGGCFAAIDEIVVKLAELANRTGPRQISVKVAEGRARAGGVLLDNSKLKSLGWSPKYSLEEGIAKTYAGLARSKEDALCI